MSLYHLLDRSWIYKLSQWMVAPGATIMLTRHVRHVLRSLPSGGPLLDVGCGPSSWLWRCGLQPVGVDVSPEYVASYQAAGGEALVGSATALPFADQSFAGVWSIGLLHHLKDADAAQAIREMLRVRKNGGYVVIVDAVLPISRWSRPLAWWLRKRDRGGFVRDMADHQTLFEPGAWRFERHTYALTGLECSMAINTSP